MKIAFVLPGSGLSGGTKTVFELAKRLNALPLFNSVVVTDSFPSWFNDPPPLILNSPVKSDLSAYDVIITTFYNQKALYKIWGQKKLHLHLCQGYEGDYLEDLHMESLRKEVEDFYRLPYPKMVVSRFLIPKLQNLTSAPIYYVGQAIDLSLFKPDPQVPKDTVLIVGQFELPFKGVKKALLLAQKIKERYPYIKIVRVSPTDTREKEASFEIDEFLVAVSPSEMPKLYHRALLSIYFPSKEGFGLPVLESLACGTPVIGSDIPALREICGPQYPLFSSPHGGLNFAISLLENLDYYQTIVQQGLKRAKLFTFKKLIIRFLLGIFKGWWYYRTQKI